MSSPIVAEGTWEELTQRESEWSGKRLRLIVMSSEEAYKTEHETMVETGGGLIIMSDCILDENQKNGDRKAEAITMLAIKSSVPSPGRLDWLKTVGKYPVGSPINKAFEEGSRLRNIESSEDWLILER